MLSESLLTPALSKEIELSLGPSRAHERKKLALGSCALAWAVKEVPDSKAGPPAAELPRQTDIDPLPKVKRERPGHGVSVPSALQSNPSGRVSERQIEQKESCKEAPARGVGAIMDRQALGVA